MLYLVDEYYGLQDRWYLVSAHRTYAEAETAVAYYESIHQIEDVQYRIREFLPVTVEPND